MKQQITTLHLGPDYFRVGPQEEHLTRFRRLFSKAIGLWELSLTETPPDWLSEALDEACKALARESGQ